MNSIMTEDINKEAVGGGIQSKEQLKKFISEDALANDIKNNSVNYYLGLFYGLESAHAFKYLKTMRFLEYHSNNNGIWHKLWRIFYKVKLSKLGMKYNLHITPNTCGYGLQIHHIFGGGQILNIERAGNYCSFNAGVVLGVNDTSRKPILEDHVCLGPGAMVFGGVTIGKHVFVAPNAVVTKDIPENSICVGANRIISN